MITQGFFISGDALHFMLFLSVYGVSTVDVGASVSKNNAIYHLPWPWDLGVPLLENK